MCGEFRCKVCNARDIEVERLRDNFQRLVNSLDAGSSEALLVEYRKEVAGLVRAMDNSLHRLRQREAEVTGVDGK